MVERESEIWDVRLPARAHELITTMSLLQRMSHDLKAGWVRVRYGTAKVATRALQETELVRLRLQLRRLDEQMADLHREVGERAVTLYDRGEPVERVLTDVELVRLVGEVTALKAERAKLIVEMEDIRSGE
jgi:hypothetical protein